MSGWESNELEHTFRSGRTMTIRKSLPMQWLVLRSVENGDSALSEVLSQWGSAGALTLDDDDPSVLPMAVKIERAIVEGMFLRPRIWWDEEEMPHSPSPPDGEAPYHLFVADLTDDELTEVVELAMEGVAKAARFQGQLDGADDRSGGESVEQKPKRASKSGARKR